MGPPRSSWLGGWVGGLVLPTRYTHPARPQGEVGAWRAAVLGVPETVRGTVGTCTYDRFEHQVGEPRGVEYRGVIALFGTVWHCLALCTAV